MLVYPPENHETTSKTIFLIGSFKHKGFLANKKIEASRDGSFCEMVNLKLGLNSLDLNLDDESFSRKIYRKPLSIENKNTLKDFSVKKNIIELPLSINPTAINIKQESPYSLSVALSKISLHFNSIKYTDLKRPLVIEQIVSEPEQTHIGIVSRAEIKEIEIISSAQKTKIKIHQIKEAIKERAAKNSEPTKTKQKLSSKGYSMVCLDPGHGGPALGAVSPQGITEKQINLELCLKISEELNRLNIPNVLTRKTDKEMTLTDRVSFTKKIQNALFISIHHNAVPDYCNPNKHRGFSCHYFHEGSYLIAERISKFLKKHYSLRFAGIYKQDLHVLRENYEQDAILIEMGYLIHPVESILLTDTEFQHKTAKILAMAISEIVK